MADSDDYGTDNYDIGTASYGETVGSSRQSYEDEQSPSESGGSSSSSSSNIDSDSVSQQNALFGGESCSNSSFRDTNTTSDYRHDDDDEDDDDDGSDGETSSEDDSESDNYVDEYGNESDSSEAPPPFEGVVGYDPSKSDEVFSNETDVEQARKVPFRERLAGEFSGNPQKKTLAIVLAVACLVLVVLAIGLGAGLAVRSRSKSNSGKETDNKDGNNSEGLEDVGSILLAPPTDAPARMPVSLPPIDGDADNAVLVDVEVVLASYADTTVYRDGTLSSSSNGDEATMLVQNGSPGNPELPSAYSLVQFRNDAVDGDDVVGGTATFCLEHVPTDGASDRVVTYSVCVLAGGPGGGASADVESLTGDTANYRMPDDCLEQKLVEFGVRPADTEVCMDVSPLVFGSGKRKAGARHHQRALRGREGHSGGLQRARGLQAPGAAAADDDDDDTIITMMIDNLVPSDEPGDRFVTSNGDPDQMPSLSITGKQLVECQSIYDTICPEFSILCSWIESLGFEESLVSGSDVSLFAPTDAAISRVFGASDTPDNDLVRDILRYHIVTGSVIELTDVDCDSGAPVTIPNGQGVEISCRDGTVFLAGDGNDADALPRITDPGIRACNGIVHAIDGLILGEAEDIDVGPGCQTFDELVCSKENLSALCQLSGLIEADSEGAELFNTLNNGAFTIFAPNNEAALDLQGIDVSSTEAILNVLRHHAVPDVVLSASDLVCDERLAMANGGFTTTRCEGDAVFQAGEGNTGPLPQIVEADLAACTGVVHVVDKIILPEQCESVYDIACSTPEFSRFCGWIEAAGLEAALDGSSNNELFSSLTVFAPTNVAIENYDLLGFSDSMFNNETDAGAIRDILLFHTIAGSVIESSAIDCSNSSSLSLTTANGGSAEISCALDGFVVTGDANANTTAAEAVVRITTPDVAACNGILHGIDGVVPSLPGTISPPGLDGPPPDVLPDDEDCQSFGDAVCSRADLEDFCRLVGLSRNDPEGVELLNALDTTAATVFAPANAFFSPPNEGLFAYTSEGSFDLTNPGDVTEILRNHVVLGTKLLLEDLVCDQTLEMSNNSTTTTECGMNQAGTEVVKRFQVGDGNSPGNPEVIDYNLVTCTGVVHILNGAILPLFSEATATPTSSITVEMSVGATPGDTDGGTDGASAGATPGVSGEVSSNSSVDVTGGASADTSASANGTPGPSTDASASSNGTPGLPADGTPGASADASASSNDTPGVSAGDTPDASSGVPPPWA